MTTANTTAASQPLHASPGPSANSRTCPRSRKSRNNSRIPKAIHSVSISLAQEQAEPGRLELDFDALGRFQHVPVFSQHIRICSMCNPRRRRWARRALSNRSETSLTASMPANSSCGWVRSLEETRMVPVPRSRFERPLLEGDIVECGSPRCGRSRAAGCPIRVRSVAWSGGSERSCGGSSAAGNNRARAAASPGAASASSLPRPPEKVPDEQQQRQPDADGPTAGHRLWRVATAQKPFLGLAARVADQAEERFAVARLLAAGTVRPARPRRPRRRSGRWPNVRGRRADGRRDGNMTLGVRFPLRRQGIA